jgi:hypothetical protein
MDRISSEPHHGEKESPTPQATDLTYFLIRPARRASETSRLNSDIRV